MSTVSGRTAPLVCATLLAVSFPVGASAQARGVSVAPAPAAPAIAAAASRQAEQPVAAQAEQPAVQPAQPVARVPRTERSPRTPRPAPVPAVAPSGPRAERPEYVSKGVNIRIDATVSELRGEQVLGKKVVSVTLVDGGRGQVRSTQQVPYRVKGSDSFSYQNAPLNMDADATLREDGRVRVSLTLDYRGGPRPTDPAQAGLLRTAEDDTLDQGIRQSVTVVLDSGTPLVVAQSSDAVGDRRVQLEVKATVLK